MHLWADASRTCQKHWSILTFIKTTGHSQKSHFITDTVVCLHSHFQHPQEQALAIVAIKGSVILPSCSHILKSAKGFQFISISWKVYGSEFGSFLKCFKINYHSSRCATHLIIVLLLVSWFKHAANYFPHTWEECWIRISISN